MSLEKAIFYHKEHRKPYHGCKAVDFTCRNHGTCSYCESNRLYSYFKQLEKINDMIKEFYRNYKDD